MRARRFPRTLSAAVSPTRPRNDVFAQAIAWSVVVHLALVVMAAVPIAGRSLVTLLSGGFAPAPVPPAPALREIEIEVPTVEVVEKPDPQRDESFIHTDGLPEATEAPENARRISDRNTRTASEGAADPNGPAVPSQDGIDVPVVEVVRQALSEGESEAAPGPPATPMVAAAAAPPAPAPTPEPTPAPQPAPPPTPLVEKTATVPDADAMVAVDTPKPEAPPTPPELALREPRLDEIPPRPVEKTPPPPATPPKPAQPAVANTPPAPAPGFQGQREKTKLSGSISNRGPSSVDAADTPVGRYMKRVTTAVEKEWHRKRNQFADFVTYGTIKLEFWVDRQGRVQSLSIKNRNGANAVMQDFTLNAVLDAQIPPMPAGLTEILDNERLQITYDIIVY